MTLKITANGVSEDDLEAIDVSDLTERVQNFIEQDTDAEAEAVEVEATFE
jgi:hypothetical protein